MKKKYDNKTVWILCLEKHHQSSLYDEIGWDELWLMLCILHFNRLLLCNHNYMTESEVVVFDISENSFEIWKLLSEQSLALVIST